MGRLCPNPWLLQAHPPRTAKNTSVLQLELLDSKLGEHQPQCLGEVLRKKMVLPMSYGHPRVQRERARDNPGVLQPKGCCGWLRDKGLMGYREIPAGAMVQRLQSGLSIRSSAEKT